MARLSIEPINNDGGLQTMRIGDFAEGELQELKSLPNMEAKEKLLTMIDERNDGRGTCWVCGYGVYGLWFDNEYAYLRIGTSCD